MGDVVHQGDLELGYVHEALRALALLVGEHDVRAVVRAVGVLAVPAVGEGVDPLDFAALRADRVEVGQPVFEARAGPARPGVGRAVGALLGVTVKDLQAQRHRLDRVDAAADELQGRGLRLKDGAVVVTDILVRTLDATQLLVVLVGLLRPLLLATRLMNTLSRLRRTRRLRRRFRNARHGRCCGSGRRSNDRLFVFGA